MDPEILALWQRYRDTGDTGLREQLILHYSPLVKYVAGRVASGMPQHVEHTDLVAYGIFGLMDAIEKFDVARGFKFQTYAITRIRGAIIDELRALDWVPRSVRRKARRIQQAIAAVEARKGSSADDDEIALELEIGVDELADWLSKVSLTNMVALDQALAGGDGERLSLVDTLRDTRTPGPQEHVDDEAMRELLRTAIGRLGEREQKVLALYYFEGLTLRQIGEILGVTESRICQIHTKAVLSLRTRLTASVAG